MLIRAIILLSLICSVFASGADPILVKAESLLKAGHEPEGKQMLARYLTANENAAAYMQVGSLYARLRKWSDSVHYFEIASKRNEKDALVWYELALAQHQNKETDAAVASLRRSLAIAPGSAKALLALGEILELSHDRYDARNTYASALAKLGNRADLRGKLCWLYYQDNFIAEAIKECSLAQKLNPGDVVSWTLWGRALYRNQQRPEAFKVFKDILSVFPKSSLTYRARGLIYYDEKAYEQAVIDLGKAFGLDPNDDEAGVNLARSLFALGYYDRALPIYIEVCKLDRSYRFEFLSKQRELTGKDQGPMADRYQEELEKF